MPEPIDVLTSDGARTGAVIDKADAHRTGAWHAAAHVWILTHDGRILLQRRALIKENWPGLWDVSVAGHVAAGETSVEAAIREAREELGLTLIAEELMRIGTVIEQCVLNGGTYIDNEIHEIFVTRRDVNLKSLILDPNEVADVRLVTPDELAELEIVPHPDEYALLRRLV